MHIFFFSFLKEYFLNDLKRDLYLLFIAGARGVQIQRFAQSDARVAGMAAATFGRHPHHGPDTGVETTDNQ